VAVRGGAGQKLGKVHMERLQWLMYWQGTRIHMRVLVDIFLPTLYYSKHRNSVMNHDPSEAIILLEPVSSTSPELFKIILSTCRST
jgi:hypothetical protein